MKQQLRKVLVTHTRTVCCLISVQFGLGTLPFSSCSFWTDLKLSLICLPKVYPLSQVRCNMLVELYSTFHPVQHEVLRRLARTVPEVQHASYLQVPASHCSQRLG